MDSSNLFDIYIIATEWWSVLYSKHSYKLENQFRKLKTTRFQYKLQVYAILNKTQPTKIHTFDQEIKDLNLSASHVEPKEKL